MTLKVWANTRKSTRYSLVLELRELQLQTSRGQALQKEGTRKRISSNWSKDCKTRFFNKGRVEANIWARALSRRVLKRQLTFWSVYLQTKAKILVKIHLIAMLMISRLVWAHNPHQSFNWQIHSEIVRLVKAKVAWKASTVFQLRNCTIYLAKCWARQ